MIIHVLKIAIQKMSFLDGFILFTGLFSIALILTCTIIKYRKLDSKLAPLFISLYQYGIEACPLLGTLGTVISLINSSMNSSELQGSFLFALTSTLWGLIMALICKFLESLFRLNEYFEEKKD